MYQKEKSSNPNVVNVEELAYKPSISFSTLYGQGNLKTNMWWQIHRQAYWGEGRGDTDFDPLWMSAGNEVSAHVFSTL